MPRRPTSLIETERGAERQHDYRNPATRPIVIAATIQEKDVKPLGSVRGDEYVAVKGRDHEYIVGERVSDPRDVSLGPADIVIAYRTSEVVDGTFMEGSLRRRAMPVPKGTYQQLVDRDRTAQAARDNVNRLLPVDYLDRFPLFAARNDSVIPMPATAISSRVFVVEGDPPSDDDPIRRGYVPGRGAARGREAIMQRLAETGAKVGISRTGAVTVEAPGRRLIQDIRDAIRAVEPIILGDPCEYDHGADEPPEAWTLLEPGNPRASDTRSASSGYDPVF
jgi:hypothetical protein